MKTELIADWGSLQSLEGDWNGLLRRSRADCPFLTWEWVTAWRAVVGDAVRPLVVVVRDDDGTLAAIAPFYLMELRLWRVIRYRALRILGDYQTGAEYLDWIVAGDRERDATRAIACALKDAGDHWDCMWIPYVSGWTGARERIIEACTGVGFYCRERLRDFSAIELPADYPSYEKSLSPKMRAEVRKRRREVFGELEGSLSRCTSEENLPHLLDGLFSLNHRRWMSGGQPGSFVRKPLEARFCREFTRIALHRGWLRLVAVAIGSDLKAAQIGYVYNNVFYSLQEGFDPDGPPGTGNALRSRIIEECTGEGVRMYDFLGGFTEHKRRWLAKPRFGRDVFVGRRCRKNALLFSAGFWPTGRHVRPCGIPAISASSGTSRFSNERSLSSTTRGGATRFLTTSCGRS